MWRVTRASRRSGGAVAALSLLVALRPAEGEAPRFADIAALLVKSAPFVEWPPAVFVSANSPVTICVMADDPLAPLLRRAANGRKDGNRPFVVRRIRPDESAGACEIFYFEPDSPTGVAIAAALRNRPVLTATSAGNDTSVPAMIVFAVDHGRVRFDIDNAAALRARVEIGSNLLALARNMSRAP